MAEKRTSKGARKRSAAKSHSVAEEAGSPQPEPNQSATEQGEAENSGTPEQPEQRVTVAQLLDAIFKSLEPDAPRELATRRTAIIRDYLLDARDQHPIAKDYNILILHDEGRMVKGDADHIYSAAAKFDGDRPLLLVLYSTGGDIGSAYLIGKLCRENAFDTFSVVVPRQAKSAATLICCAADKIHMGALSELGPIDPQIGKMPALGLKSSIEHIAELTKEYSHASDMLAKYLHLSLEPIHLGYFERVAESACQYAERLLKLHSASLPNSSEQIASTLVYSYKDHGFVIDKQEATEIFGSDVVQTGTPEYALGNDIYERLMLISRLASIQDHYFYHIGGLESEPRFQRTGGS